MRKFPVNLGKRSYHIITCCDQIDTLGRFIGRLSIGRDAVVVTNPLIKRLFGKRVMSSLASAGITVKFELVPDSERAKSERYCLRLLNNISRFDNSRRRLFLMALGGGVIGDLAGFVASIYRRGIPYIQVPTTLLAQVDSAIGGKVAIDLEAGKNLAGAFYQPRLVFSDASFLKTLTRKDMLSGLAEVIKYGIIRSPGLFRFIEKDYGKILKQDKKALEYMVYTCSHIKAGIVEKDERDNKDMRVVLNLGHTIGHAIEAAAHYNRSYNHGHAIALGTIAASFISRELGLLDKPNYLRIKDLIKKVGLPTNIRHIDARDVFLAQEHDKKFIHGRNRFVLPVGIGRITVRENIPGALITGAIAALYKRDTGI